MMNPSEQAAQYDPLYGYTHTSAAGRLSGADLASLGAAGGPFNPAPPTSDYPPPPLAQYEPLYGPRYTAYAYPAYGSTGPPTFYPDLATFSVVKLYFPALVIAVLNRFLTLGEGTYEQWNVRGRQRRRFWRIGKCGRRRETTSSGRCRGCKRRLARRQCRPDQRETGAAESRRRSCRRGSERASEWLPQTTTQSVFPQILDRLHKTK